MGAPGARPGPPDLPVPPAPLRGAPASSSTRQGRRARLSGGATGPAGAMPNLGGLRRARWHRKPAQRDGSRTGTPAGPRTLTKAWSPCPGPGVPRQQHPPPCSAHQALSGLRPPPPSNPSPDLLASRLHEGGPLWENLGPALLLTPHGPSAPLSSQCPHRAPGVFGDKVTAAAASPAGLWGPFRIPAPPVPAALPPGRARHTRTLSEHLPGRVGFAERTGPPAGTQGSSLGSGTWP